MAHTVSRMSYGDASIIKALISAFYCYLIYFFNFQLFKLFIFWIQRENFYFAGRAHLSLRATASQRFRICLQTLRYSPRSLFHFFTQDVACLPGVFNLSVVVFEGKPSLDKLSNLLLFQQTLKRGEVKIFLRYQWEFLHILSPLFKSDRHDQSCSLAQHCIIWAYGSRAPLFIYIYS